MATTNPRPPQRWTRAALEQQYERELEYSKRLDAALLNPKQGQPLPVAFDIESKQSHTTKAKWKNGFRKGQLHTLGAHTFEVVGITRRGLVLRKNWHPHQL